MTIDEKRSLLVELHGKVVAINTKADQEKRSLTKEENADFDKIINEAEALKIEIESDEKRSAKMQGLNEYLTKPTSKPVNAIGPAAPQHSEYRNIGDWFLNGGYEEVRTMSMGSSTTGGILVPEKFSTDLLSMKSEGQIVRPRANVIPAGDPPDAKLTIPVLNQFGANGIYAGMDMTFIAEGGTKADNTPAFTYVEVEPVELGGSTIVTDKLLRNADVLTSWLATMYNSVVTGKSEYAFLRGSGVGEPTGVIGCAAEKTVTRNTASSVLFADVRTMLASLPAESWGKAVWVANQTVLPQLINLVDGAGNTIFMVGDITKSVPATLFGLPIVFTGKTPVLGTKGDLLLCDFSYYLIKDGSGPYIASSEHVYFTTNKTVVKCFTMVDGIPWPTSTLLLEDGTTTVSPFVVLV